jgi:hypothetical protein
VPETRGKATPHDEVSYALHGCIADLASVLIKAMFLQQVLLGLNAVLDQEPAAEEFDFWRSTTLPYELIEITTSSRRDNHLVRS